MNNRNIKVVILGDASVGKSSLVTRLVKNIFVEDILETVGASFALYTSQESIFEIWDTAGQERYAPISRLYYANANIIIVVFDIRVTSSWKRVNELLYEVKRYNNQAYFIVVGNKLDLTDNIPFETWIHPNLKQEERNIIYVSAKTGVNMHLLKQRLRYYSDKICKPNQDLEIVDLEEIPDKKCSC